MAMPKNRCFTKAGAVRSNFSSTSRCEYTERSVITRSIPFIARFISAVQINVHGEVKNAYILLPPKIFPVIQHKIFTTRSKS